MILDGDAEYMKLGGNWMTNQETVLNDVEGIYSREVQIQFQVRLQAIHTNAGDFSGTAVCVSSAQDLLTQVNAYWAGRNEGRDLVHLFSGKYFDGGVVGCSNEPSLGENQYSASLTQHIPKGSYSAVEAQQALITAHEMGHTFNGDHMAAAESQDSTCNCLDDTIMWPTFYGTSPTAGGHQMVAHFSAANIQRIVTEAQSSLCQNFTGAGLQSTRFNVFVDDFYQSGAALAVGCPTDATSPWSNGTVQHFSGGSAGTGAILLSTAQSTPGWLYGSLWSYYQGRGGPAATFPDGSAIGYPVQNQKAGPGSSVTYDQTVFATMENGQIQSYTSGSKAGQTYSIHGPILSKWTQACLSGKCTSGGPLGMVATEETSASNSPSGTSGTVQGFENGQIYRITSGSRAGAAFYVHAAIWNKYVSLGATSSSLGFPISDEYAWNSGVRNDFEGGYAYTSGSTVNVVTSGAETVSKPSAPSGPGTGSPGSSYSFSTGAAASSQGNQVRYRLVWGDGTDSGWLAAGVSSASKSWANPGTYAVTAQAANASLSVLSPVSDPLTVKVATTPLAAPVLTSPGDGSTGVTNGTALTWNAVSGSAGYSVYFGTTNPPPRVASASGTSYSPGIVQGLTYYWTVASIDPNNNNGEAAAPVRSFAAVKVPVSFTSSPSGLPVTVDGATQNTPFTVSLAAGPHTVSTPSTISGAGSQNVFSAWSDSGAASHSITVTAGQAASFNAAFTTQYQLTLAASPASGGSVTQGSGSFYTAGTVVSVAASPASGFLSPVGPVPSRLRQRLDIGHHELAPDADCQLRSGACARLRGFNSTPSGLPITIDGATQNTPFSVSLSAGSHTISTPRGCSARARRTCSRDGPTTGRSPTPLTWRPGNPFRTLRRSPRNTS